MLSESSSSESSTAGSRGNDSNSNSSNKSGSSSSSSSSSRAVGSGDDSNKSGSSVAVSSNSDSKGRRRERRHCNTQSELSAVTDTQSFHGAQEQQQPKIAGFYVPKGMVLNVPAYLKRLWRACESTAASRGDDSAAVFHQQQVCF